MSDTVRNSLGICVITAGVATLVRLFFYYRAGMAELADLKRRLNLPD